MGLINWLYDKISPPKSYGELIERKLQRKINNKYFHIQIKTEKSEYSIMNTVTRSHIEWVDDIADREYRKRINWRPALDKDGNQEFHYGLPFGGEIETDGKLRKYHHWKVDAIPLMIHSPNYLYHAPMDLLSEIDERMDEIAKEINEQKWISKGPGHYELKIKKV